MVGDDSCHDDDGDGAVVVGDNNTAVVDVVLVEWDYGADGNNLASTASSEAMTCCRCHSYSNWHSHLHRYC